MAKLMTIDTVDMSGDQNFHLFWQRLLHHEPILTNSVFDLVTGVVDRAGDAGTVGLLRIFGHGSPGCQRVGGGQAKNINQNQKIAVDGSNRLVNETLLSMLKPVFAKNAVVQLHGCRVAQGWEGINLIRRLASLWDVRVQAATDTQYPDIGEDEFEGDYFEANGASGGSPTLTYYRNSW